MNRFVFFVLGAAVGVLFKDNIRATVRGATRSAVKAAMELSEDVQDIRAEAAEEQQSAAAADRPS